MMIDFEFGEYIDSCLHIAFTVVVADLSFRMFKFTREYLQYPKYYESESRAREILKRTMSYDIRAIWFLVLILIMHLIRNNGNFLPTIYGQYIPLYWIYFIVKLKDSQLDYSHWIRGDHGLDYAAGMASNYFQGYLKLTLPSHNDLPGIRERIEQYSVNEKVEFAVNRLLILIPNTLYVSPKIESPLLERASPLVQIHKNRAGVHRPFRNDVYRFTQLHNNKFYYVTMEGATPLVSFFDAMAAHSTCTWQMKTFQREILLKFYKHLKKLTTECHETRNEIELVFYNALTPSGRQQDIGEVVWAHITNLWQENRA